ncbi:MAG: sigma-70 family RNA polymerase sigma factor [Aureliella sp.]
MNEPDKQRLEAAFDRIREDLKRLAKSRLDKRLNGRVDSSDIVQEAYFEAFRRYSEYLQNPEVSIDEWIRFLTIQTVTQAHRFHLGRQKRAVSREIVESSEDMSIVSVVDMLAGSLTSPHSAAIRAELRKAVQELIDEMSPTDREIIRLRHEELLTNDECAERIGISRSAASKRYIRAIIRLRSIAKEYV